MYKGGVGVTSDNSWEAWWAEEQVKSCPQANSVVCSQKAYTPWWCWPFGRYIFIMMILNLIAEHWWNVYLPLIRITEYNVWLIIQAHLRTAGGKFWEFILCLRFFFFQYGVSYQLDVIQGSTSILVCTSREYMLFFRLDNLDLRDFFWPLMLYTNKLNGCSADQGLPDIADNLIKFIFTNLNVLFYDIPRIAGVCLLLDIAVCVRADFQGTFLSFILIRVKMRRQMRHIYIYIFCVWK